MRPHDIVKSFRAYIELLSETDSNYLHIILLNICHAFHIEAAYSFLIRCTEIDITMQLVY